MKAEVKIGSIVKLNFRTLRDAENFAKAYNTARKLKDFEQKDFDTEIEKRGFDFKLKVWTMLRHHGEEDDFHKYKAIVIR